MLTDAEREAPPFCMEHGSYLVLAHHFIVALGPAVAIGASPRCWSVACWGSCGVCLVTIPHGTLAAHSWATRYCSRGPGTSVCSYVAAVRILLALAHLPAYNSQLPPRWPPLLRGEVRTGCAVYRHVCCSFLAGAGAFGCGTDVGRGLAEHNWVMAG